ncbi:MAG: glutamine amidotransferase-related protein, partial [Segetibacter sp.]
MKPFLLIQSRPEDAASDNEYDAFLGFSKLSANSLHRIRAEAGDLPEIRLTDYSGIILGGGPNNVTDPHSKKSAGQKQLEQNLDKLLDDIIKNDFPFLGACYGVGLLTNHQRGVMGHRYHEPVGPLSIELTPSAASDDLLRGLPKKFEAFGGHKEACENLATSATLLATSKNCPVQMFRIKQNVYAVQFHP